MSCRAVVFDFFGVVCSEVAPFWLARYLPQVEAAKIKAEIVRAADLGEVSQDEMFSMLSEVAQVPAKQIEREWRSYARIDRQVVDFITALRNRYRLGLLTNSPSLFVREILDQHRLGDLFEVIIVSSEIHCAKPDPAIYRRMLASLNVQASETVMIDDNPENVAAAIAVGMEGIVFQSCSQLQLAIAH